MNPGMVIDPDSCAAGRIDRRPFGGLFLAQVLSVFGNSMTAIAIPWFVLDTTGSVSLTGVVAATSVLPTIIAMALGSAAIDRFGFRRMSIVSDLLSMVTVAMIPLAHLTVGLNLPTLLALVFLGALFDAPGSTARSSMVPELARRAGIALERANGISQGVSGIAMMAGPVVGGVLIAVIGASNVLWFNAATFALSVLIVTLLIPAVARTDDKAAPSSYLDEVREGWRFVLGHPLIRPIMLIATSVNFVTSPIFGLLIPAYVNTRIGESSILGLLLAGFGAGNLAGIALYTWVGARLPRFPLCVAGVGVFAVACATLAAGASWPILLVVLFVTGLVSAPVNPIIFTVIQEIVPTSLLGRAMGAIFATAILAAPLGFLVSGVLVEVAGLGVTFTLAGSLLGLVTLYMARSRVLRRLSDGIGLAPATATATATVKPATSSDFIRMAPPDSRFDGPEHENERGKSAVLVTVAQ